MRNTAANSGTSVSPFREKAVSTIGSKHKLKRWQIDITDVSEIPADQVVNHVVKYQIGE